MDAIRNSRKRKHSSSSPPHPLFGTLTRSKSQLFLHRNCSGQLRSDTLRTTESYAGLHRCPSPRTGRRTDTRQQSSDCGNDDMLLVKDLCKKTKPNREASTGDDDELSHMLIKDLRARRVYSPQSASGTCSNSIKNVFPRENGVDSNCRDQKIAGSGFGSSSSVENSGCERAGSKVNEEIDALGKGFLSEGQNMDEINSILCSVLNEYRSDKDKDLYLDDEMGAVNEENESADVRFSCKAQIFDQVNPESSGESSNLQDNKHSGGGNSSEKIDDSKEELVLTTPLDAEICGNSKVNEDEEKRGEVVHVKDAHLIGSTEKNTDEGFRPKDHQRNDSVLKSKSIRVLRPRFQGKLFKAPGSVSYRRLFPFLTNIIGDDSGTPKLGHCRKHEKGIGGQQFQLPLLSQSQEPSKHELETYSCTMQDTSGSGASAGDAEVAPANELSFGNRSKFTSPHYLLELAMQSDAKEVASECLSVPSVNDKCLSKTKADPATDIRCVKDVPNALHNDDFKLDSKHNNGLGDYAKANHGGCTSEQFCVLNEDCVLTTPPDADLCGNSEVSVGRIESFPQVMYQVKTMDLTGSTKENAGEGFCLKTEKSRDSVPKTKSVLRPHLHRKLFKTPGSVSYRRLLPFLMDFTKDDSGTPKLGHHQKDEADMYAKRLELPLSSQSQDASMDAQKTDSGPMHGTVESNAFVKNILVDPANKLSHGKPKLSSSKDLPELPMQLDAKEVVHECLSAPSVNEHSEKVEIGSKHKCLSDSKVDLSSVTVDFHFVKNVASKLVHNKKSRQHTSEPPPKAQNLLYYPNVSNSNLTFGHHSSKEKGFIIDSDERNQFVSLEKHESVSRYPPEGQTLNHMDPNMLDAEENETSSHASSRSDDAVVLNHVRVSNEEPRPPSDKIILEKSDMAGHDGYIGGSDLRGIVYGPSMPSKGGDNKNASCVGEIRNGTETKATMLLNRCSRIKLLKHAGSFNYKRLLPFLLNSAEDNSCASVNDHYPKLQKCLEDQTPYLPISASDFRVTHISNSNGCVFPVEHCRGNSGTQQQTEILACDDLLNNGSSSPRSSAQIPESHSSHDNLQDEQVVLHGHSKLESSPDPPISVHRIDLPVTPLGPVINEVITREEEATSPLPQSSVYSEVKGNSSFLISSNGEKLLETDGCCQNLSQLKALEQLPAVAFKKGILKRNPRGCRGLCTCLNCVSFRLHAERAFEFSRNQMLDAEELAVDLIKELSHLRNMLERSTDSVNNQPIFYGNQVKEACRKAFAAEQHAKDRLSQMNDDLNIHGRISSLQRPRVRFADHVEEKVIPPGE